MPIVSPKIPQGLEELMRGLAKSVIKENPENIYEFAAEYFENLLRERDGTVDQRYKKFATYKVYKKNKMARRQQRDKDLIPIRPSTAYDLEQGSSSSKQNSDYESIEKIILPPSHMPPREQLSVSSESEINTSVKQEAFVEVEGTPSRNESTTQDDEDDIKNMELDDEMAQAALKIQSTFRGHKVRRDMKDSKNITSIDMSELNVESGSEIVTSDGHASEIDSEIISSQGVQEDDVNILNPSEEIVKKEEQNPNQSSLVTDSVEGTEINLSDEGGHDTNNNPPVGEIIPLKDSVDLESNDVAVCDDIESQEIDSTLPQEEIEYDAVKTTSQEEPVIESSQEEMVISEKASQGEVSEPKVNDVCEGSEIEKNNSIEVENLGGCEEIFQKSESIEQEQNENLSTTPPQASVDDDVANMVLDEEMEEAAVKIQSAFRGHKVRKEMSTLPENESLQENLDLNNDEPKIDEGLIENSTEISIMGENNLNETLEGIESKDDDEQELEGENQQSESPFVSKEISTEQIECDKIDETELIEATDEILINEKQNSPSESITNEHLENNEIEKFSTDEEKIITESTQHKNYDENVLENTSKEHPETLTKDDSTILKSNEIFSSMELNQEPLETDSDKKSDTNVESVEIQSPDVQERKNSEIKSFEDENLPSGDNDSVENLKKGDNINEATGSIESENESLNAIVNASIELQSDSPKQSSLEACENLNDEEIAAELIQASVDDVGLDDMENTQILTGTSQDEGLINDDIGKQISVEEEICEQKIISNLEPEEQQSSLDKQPSQEENNTNELLDEEDKKASLEKMSSTEIKYEKLQESVDGSKLSPTSLEREDTEEKSIDAESGNSKSASVENDEVPLENETILEGEKSTIENVEGKNSLDNEQDIEKEASLEQNESINIVEKETIKLEKILQNSISPIDLIDEVVNEVATMRADEILALTNSDVEQIIKPELIKLNTQEQIPSSDEFEPIKDEILTPEKEESEIPYETQNPIDEPLVVVEQTDTFENVEEPNLLESIEEIIKPTQEISTEDKNEINLEEPLTTSEPQENLEDMILDDEMEDAAVKIQAAFRGHKTRKETLAMTLQSESENANENGNQDENQAENQADSTTIVIDQCSEGNEETQEHDDTEMQDTSADIEEIQESEAVTNQENENDVQEEEEATEQQDDTNENQEETENAEEGGEGGSGVDDPDQNEEGETSQQNQNDDDDVANMVLDDEMEQAALKIQSTFRGHKSRKEIKPKADDTKTEESENSERNESAENLDDDIANMVLDDEMEQAALKIQSTFRGHKVRKDKQNENTETEQTQEEETEPEESKEEEQPPKQEEEPQSSTEKSAQQLQDEEDIANLVMDDKMEETALKIQSAFRGKFKRKQPKDDGEESFESSAENGSDYGDESHQKSEEESPADIYEYFGLSNEDASDERGNSYEDVEYNNYSANRQSYTDDTRYSLERFDSKEQRYEETIYPMSNKSEDDINLMHGGGIFVEPSHESPGEGELLSGSGSDGEKDPNRDNSIDKKASFNSDASNDFNESKENSKEIVEVVEEKIIESFDFEQNPDTAEALYYSLKKNEIEAQKRFQESIKESSVESEKNKEPSSPTINESQEEDNDDVVVLKSPSNAPKILKYGMSMDDRLLGSILSQDYSQKARKIYPDDYFDPLLEESMRNHPQFLERFREMSGSGEDEIPVTFEPDNMGDEDQFDEFYSGNIRSKIMASSISIADSDYFDPTNNKSIIDDDTIRTALETIHSHSTDSESTIASAATKINTGEQHNLITRRNNNQYSSIGNAAIDKSLDDFIQAQEMRVDKFDEEPEGSCSPPPPRKQESNDDTWTSDTCTESDKKHPIAGVQGIKLAQKTSHFLTVDERRRTLHREDAIQRNSTRSQEEDSSKSSSSEKIIDKNILQSDAAIVTAVQGQSSIIDTEITVPVLEKQAAPKASSNINKSVKVPIIRQKTMPVQIESNIIRVLPPKHLRKRIKSAESGDKKRKFSK